MRIFCGFHILSLATELADVPPRLTDDYGNELRDGQKLLEKYEWQKRTGRLEARQQILDNMYLNVNRRQNSLA